LVWRGERDGREEGGAHCWTYASASQVQGGGSGGLDMVCPRSAQPLPPSLPCPPPPLHLSVALSFFLLLSGRGRGFHIHALSHYVGILRCLQVNRYMQAAEQPTVCTSAHTSASLLSRRRTCAIHTFSFDSRDADVFADVCANVWSTVCCCCHDGVCCLLLLSLCCCAATLGHVCVLRWANRVKAGGKG